MMLIRPATAADQKSLLDLAGKTGSGLTTLPNDNDVLMDKINLSQQSFSQDVISPNQEYYLFLLEDTDTGQIVGTSALAATVGISEAFYTYHVGTIVHSAPKLDVYNVVNALFLGNDYTGATEICTLFLAPDYRKDGNGQLLSRARFLFMAMHLQRFAPLVIAEMRGYSDADGNSPFWDAVGSHFFSMSFTDADAISGEGNNQFIAELMPKYPIYLPLLPETAKDVIGEVHPDTRPALKMLEDEGFKYNGYVDIFDAGPSIEVETNNIKTIRESLNYSVSIVTDDEFETLKTEQCMLANNQVVGFRACYAAANINQQQIIINETIANNLNVKSEDILRAFLTGR